MAVTRAPKRSAAVPVPDERAVLDVIQRGGTVQAEREAVRDVSALTDPLKNVQLRLYQSTLTEIDTVRRQQARGRRPASRHAWILDAIEEKLERERQ